IRLFTTEDAGHGGPFFYHFIILLLGCFPASIFLFHKPSYKEQYPVKDFKRWMWVMFWVVLLLFSIVKTKIVHYSSLCYFPLTYLAALQVYRLSQQQAGVKSYVRIIFLFIGSVLAVAIIALPLVGINKNKLIPYIDDPFAVANLQANVSWSYTEAVWGIVYLAGIWVIVGMFKRNFRKGLLFLVALQLVIIQVTVI